MNLRMVSIVATAAVSLGFAAVPASAQVLGGAQTYGYDRGTRAPGYHEDGTLNVFGAHIDPRGARSPGLIGGAAAVVGGVVGGATGLAGNVVGGAVGTADDLTTGSIDDRGGPREYGGRATY